MVVARYETTSWQHLYVYHHATSWHWIADRWNLKIEFKVGLQCVLDPSDCTRPCYGTDMLHVVGCTILCIHIMEAYPLKEWLSYVFCLHYFGLIDLVPFCP